MPLNPPKWTMAPMNALRAFEAAGRHGSFQRAADELAVTPGAIAQQVRKLEDWSGAALFQRHAQGVTLTPLGRRVLPDVSRGLAVLGAASQDMRAGMARAVAIAALPAIAQLWLSPRIAAVQSACPGIEISIHALDDCPPLGTSGIDLAIYPTAQAPDASDRIAVVAEDSLFPVTTPDIAARINSRADLTRVPLIHDSSWRSDWQTWLATYPVPGLDAVRGPAHSLYTIALERCMAGDGVLMGHSALIQTALADGRLVAPFAESAVAASPFWLFGPTGGDESPTLAPVIEALLRA